jgi:hypothetical protein
MIISYKKKFINQWKMFTKSKINVDFSTLNIQLSKELGQWPGTVHIFFPLVSRFCVRKEKFGNILLCFDAILCVDDLTLKIFEFCDGLTSPKKIKEFVKQSYKYNGNSELDEDIEKKLAQAGKYGVITWIPFGQPHIERKIKELEEKFGKQKNTKSEKI